MLKYKAIEILTSEEARYRRKPAAHAILDYVRNLKIAARCIVTRGVAGCYENGEIATGMVEIASFNMPVRIYIVVPAQESDRVVSDLNDMVNDGLIVLHDLNVVNHRVRNAFFPRQLMVRNVMTPDPKYVTPETALSDVVRLLLPSIFSGVPVVDAQKRPVGLITQGDLITKGHLPLRLGLLSASDENRLDEVLKRLDAKQASDVMTTPAVVVADERLLGEAVEMMLSKSIKRLPVVDEKGHLVGMLSRLDIFRTVMREAPDWHAFRAQKIEVEHLQCVKDILRRDTHAVYPETTLDEVIRIINSNDIQRVAVLDAEGKLLGLISDRDLLSFFKPQQEGMWRLLAKIKHPFTQDACQIGDLQRCLAETSAGAVMTTELITVQEDALIGHAIGLMLEKELKRLPVVDKEGRFKGMISRDSLLRTGFGGPV